MDQSLPSREEFEKVAAMLLGDDKITALKQLKKFYFDITCQTNEIPYRLFGLAFNTLIHGLKMFITEKSNDALEDNLRKENLNLVFSLLQFIVSDRLVNEEALVIANSDIFQDIFSILTNCSEYPLQIIKDAIQLLISTLNERKDLISLAFKDPICLLKPLKYFRFKIIKILFKFMKLLIDNGILSGNERNWGRLLNSIANFFTHSNFNVSKQSICLFSAICKWSNWKMVKYLSKKTIGKMFTALNVITDCACVIDLLSVIHEISKNEEMANVILKNEPDYLLIINQTKDQSKNTELLYYILSIFINLLPTPNHGEDIFNNNNLDQESQNKFLLVIQPIVEDLIINHRGNDVLCLNAYSSIVTRSHPLNPKIFRTLSTYAINPQIAPSVLLVACNIYNVEQLKNEGIWIMRSLKYVFQNQMNSKVGAVINEIEQQLKSPKILFELPNPPKAINSFEELERILEKDEPAEYFTCKVLTLITKFLCSQETIPRKYKPLIDKVVSISFELLDAFPISVDRNSESLYGKNLDLFKSPNEGKFHLNVRIVGIKEGINISVPYYADFGFLEEIILKKFIEIIHTSEDDVTLATLFNDSLDFPENEKLNTMLYLKDMYVKNNSSPTLMNAIFRCYHVAEGEFSRHQFRVGDDKTLFSINDNIFQAIAFTSQNVSQIKDEYHRIYIVNSDSVARAPPKKRNLLLTENSNYFSATEPIFKLLCRIHTIFPDINLNSSSLTSQLLNNLSYFASTFGLMSLASQIIFNYPILVPFDIRLMFFNMTAFSTPYCVYENSLNFGLASENINEFQSDNTISIFVNRDFTFEEGIYYLQTLAASNTFLHLKFLEGAVGLGPAHEFFRNLAFEFAKNKRQLWLSTNYNDEYANWPTGLFPRPDANLENMYYFGLFCAKAICLNFYCTIPFNPAFFKYLKNEPIDIKDIDEDYSVSLSEEYAEYLEGQLFVFPNLNNCELIPNGRQIEVNNQIEEYSGKQYIKLVKEKLYGEESIRNAFISGFQSLIPWEYLSIFTVPEILTILHGDSPSFTIEELYQYINLEIYQKDDEQIRWLYEIILDFNKEENVNFIKFITGLDALPIGGISKLKPQITITEFINTSTNITNIDVCLPTAKTCKYLLRLPKYSSKSILKERLLFSIYECVDVMLKD